MSISTVLDVLHVLPVAAYVLVQGHSLPVDRNDLALRRIAYRGHLEWEQREAAGATRNFLLRHVGRLAVGIVDGHRVVIGDELAVEASNNKQLRAAQLRHTDTLARSDTRQ